MAIDKITKYNFPPTKLPTRVPAEKVNELIDFVNKLFSGENEMTVDTISEQTAGSGVAIDGVTLKDGDVVMTDGAITMVTGVTELTAIITIGPGDIVGTAAGDIGHAGGAILVAAATGVTHEFVSAVLVYDFGVAAYTDGGADLVIRQGTTAVSAAIAAADLLGDTEDDIAYVNALSAADIKLTANSTLNLASTAWTNPGTAAGVLRVHLRYRSHTTGL